EFGRSDCVARHLVGGRAIAGRTEIFSMVKAPNPSCLSLLILSFSFSFAVRFGLIGALAISRLSSSGEPIPDYQIGDTLKADLVSPIRLVVIDPEETAALKQKEAVKVQVIC